MSNIASNLLNGDIITLLVASGGTLHGNYLALFTNNFTPSPANVTADFTEPLYTGYARLAITWGANYQRLDGSMATQGNLSQFQMGDADLPTTVYGYMVCSAVTAGNVLYSELFTEPQALVTVLDAVLVTPEFTMPNISAGSATQID